MKYRIIKVTLPRCSSKKSLQLILNCNKLKKTVKILYPNKILIDQTDLYTISEILERNYINIKY
jgi:hypothetical protein